MSDNKASSVKCECCRNMFHKQSILKHISHNKTCKLFYGEIRFKSMLARAKQMRNSKRDRKTSNTTELKKKCKACKKSFKSLFKHIAKKQSCKLFYGDAKIKLMQWRKSKNFQHILKKIPRRCCENCNGTFPSLLKHVAKNQACKAFYGDRTKSMVLMSKQRINARRRCKASNDVKAQCQNCKLIFRKNTLLKHIALRKACKEAYGEQFNDMKINNLIRREIKGTKKYQIIQQRQFAQTVRERALNLSATRFRRWYAFLSKEKKELRRKKEKQRRLDKIAAHKKQKEKENHEQNLKVLALCKIREFAEAKRKSSFEQRQIQRKYIPELEKLRSHGISRSDAKLLDTLQGKVATIQEKFEVKVLLIQDYVKDQDCSSTVISTYEELIEAILKEWEDLALQFKKILTAISKRVDFPLRCFDCYIGETFTYICKKCK